MVPDLCEVQLVLIVGVCDGVVVVSRTGIVTLSLALVLHVVGIIN